MTPVQQKILEIYKTTATILKKNGIPFYAIGGTCIGAVRHGGFIPWDDDMDIAVPVEDFGRFLVAARASLPKNYQIVEPLSRRGYFNLFIKVEDMETAFIEEADIPFPDSYKGIFLDVMPLAGVPDKNHGQSCYVFKIRLYHMLNKILIMPASRMNTVKTKVLWPLLYPFRLVGGARLISRKWITLIREHPFRSSSLVGYVWSHNIKKRLFERSWFDETVDLPFEDTTIPCPAGYDQYLTAHFGDYMALPPEDERVATHKGIVDIERSYRDYQKAPSLIK